MTSSYRIVFMGTPMFAVPAFKRLCRSRHRVLQVVTQPIGPRDAERRLLFRQFKEAALGLGYPIIRPPSVRTQDFCDAMIGLNPDLLVVAGPMAMSFRADIGDTETGGRQHPRIPASQIPGCCAHSMGGHQSGKRNRRYADADGQRAGYGGYAVFGIGSDSP